jgi:hypothetical protein
MRHALYVGCIVFVLRLSSSSLPEGVVPVLQVPHRLYRRANHYFKIKVDDAFEISILSSLLFYIIAAPTQSKDRESVDIRSIR